MSERRDHGRPRGRADGWAEFLDCETVRVTGRFADLVLDSIWWDEPSNRGVGTIREPVGGVDGERTISAGEAFGEFEYGPILVAVEAFEEGTPIVPGLGDHTVENPHAEACREAVLEDFEGKSTT